MFLGLAILTCFFFAALFLHGNFESHHPWMSEHKIGN